MSKKDRHLKVVISVSAILGSALVIVAALGIMDYLKVTQSGEEYPSTEVVQTSVVTSEKAPPAISEEYSVPATQPRVIEIPSIDVKAYIQKVGVASDGAMATPNNLFFTGWYTQSVVPGDTGVSIINGHVGGRYNAGIFRYLKDLEKDAVIKVQLGDLSWREFAVVSVNAYAVNDAAAPLFNDDVTIDSELHLITCDGVFDDATQTYDQRVIVVARAN